MSLSVMMAKTAGADNLLANVEKPPLFDARNAASDPSPTSSIFRRTGCQFVDENAIKQKRLKHRSFSIRSKSAQAPCTVTRAIIKSEGVSSAVEMIVKNDERSADLSLSSRGRHENRLPVANDIQLQTSGRRHVEVGVDCFKC